MSEPSSSKSNPKTVFVVGAGASQEADMPTGHELKNSIATALNFKFKFGSQMISGDHRILEALHMASGDDINTFLNACRRIHDAMPQAISIDNFIDSHSGDKQIELCGKLAIVRTILEAETKSDMFVEFQGSHRLKYDRLENTWFHSFMQLLTENCSPSNLAARLSSVALVIFNYDRCIEHYLYHAIQTYYGKDASDVAQLLHRLEVYHPYGTVGSLPWLRHDNQIAFGATPHSKQLLGLASQIKTFTEGTDESSSDVASIRSIMKTSDKLVFLGFAFHHLNIELLLPKPMSEKSPIMQRRLFATAYGISKSDTDSISAELAVKGRLSMVNIQIRNDLKCGQLFREYWRSMSFAR